MIGPRSLSELHLPLFSLLQLHWLPLRYLNTAGMLLSLVPAGHSWLTPHLLQVFMQMSPSQRRLS